MTFVFCHIWFGWMMMINMAMVIFGKCRYTVASNHWQSYQSSSASTLFLHSETCIPSTLLPYYHSPSPVRPLFLLKMITSYVFWENRVLNWEMHVWLLLGCWSSHFWGLQITWMCCLNLDCWALLPKVIIQMALGWGPKNLHFWGFEFSWVN